MTLPGKPHPTPDTINGALDFHGTFHQGIPPGENQGETCEIMSTYIT